MSWLYSQALVGEYSAATCSDGEPSAPLSGNSTQQAYCAPDKMMDFSRLSRFGMTFKPLTDTLGEALLTSYLGAFLAPTSAPQVGAQVSTENNQECGEKWRGSFTKFDPDSSSWKTHQCSLLGDLEEFSGIWPRWGLMRNGECWERPTLEQTIRGTESGLSPNGVDTFHTPNTTGLDGGSNSRKALKKRMDKLPTPAARDWKDSDKSGNRKSPGLGVVAHWPTPRTKGMCGGSGAWAQLKENTTLEEARLMGAGNGGKLNPTWVEWIMGWPLGWTDLKPLEMDKSLCVQQQHGEF